MNWFIQDIGWRVILKAVFLRQHNWGHCAMGALFVVFLMFRSTASSFWSAENRFFYHWQYADAFAIALLFGFCSLCLCIAWQAGTALGRCWRWMAELCFTGVLAFLLKVNGMEMVLRHGTIPAWMDVTAKAGFLLILVFFLIRREIVFRASRAIALVFSPVVILYFIVLLTARTYAAELSLASDSSAKPVEHGGIIVVILDQWSYQRTFSNGVVSAEFPNIQVAAESSYVFHKAYTPGSVTLDSVPSILCGVEGVSHLVKGTLWLKTETRDSPVAEYDNMFSWAKLAGYRTCAIGHYFPYADIFEKVLASCQTWDRYKFLGPGVFSVAGLMVLETLKIRCSGVSWAQSPWYYAKSRYYVNLAEQIQALWLANAADMNGKFVFVHHSIPHTPFIFSRDGFVGYSRRNMVINEELYMGNLRYADTLVGQFLKAVGSSDDVLWILTSDHSFMIDPDYVGGKPSGPGMHHVPLLVHLPGQTERYDVWDSFHTADLKAVIAEVAAHRFNSGKFEKVLESRKTQRSKK